MSVSAKFVATNDPTKARAAVGIPPAIAIIDRKTPAALPEIFSVFADKADGPAPTVFDSGQEVLGSIGPGTNSQAIVKYGQLTSAPTNGGPAAFYYKAQCVGDVTNIGARFKFRVNEIALGSTTYNGNVCIAVTQDDDWSVHPPKMSLHYVIKRDSWAVGIWDFDEPDKFVVLGTQNFYPQLDVDNVTEYEAQAWLHGNTCIIDTPDGGRFTLTDSRFASFTGPYCFWENQAPVGSTDNREGFTHIWASSRETTLPLLPAQQKPTWLFAKQATAAETVTISTAYTPVNVPGIGGETENDFVIVPPSGRILVRFDCWMIRTTAATLLAGVSWTGGSIASQVGHTTEGVVQNRVYSTHIIEGLTPGEVFACNPVMYSSATNSQILVDPDNNFRAHMTMEPL